MKFILKSTLLLIQFLNSVTNFVINNYNFNEIQTNDLNVLNKTLEWFEDSDTSVPTLEQRINLCKAKYPNYDYDSLSEKDQDMIFNLMNACRVDCVLNDGIRSIYTIYFRDQKTECGHQMFCMPSESGEAGVCQPIRISPSSSTTILTTSSISANNSTTISPSTITTTTIAPKTNPITTIAPTTSPTKTIAPTTSPTKTIAPTTSPTKTIAPTTSPTKTIAPTTSPTTSSEPTIVSTIISSTTVTKMNTKVLDVITSNGYTTNTWVTSTSTPITTTIQQISSTNSSEINKTTEQTVTENSKLWTTSSTVTTPDIKCRSAKYFRDPRDPECIHFYRCIDFGNGYNRQEYKCPNGTVFDEPIQVCQHPDELRQPCLQK